MNGRAGRCDNINLDVPNALPFKDIVTLNLFLRCRASLPGSISPTAP
jgi:hypothetical protein